ncbi:hypothetical protein [Lentzea sp.]|uniref:hypothetical protein n=1 Tax=Lentzea sp. TaxID=56099 RepID=UPI002ED0F409
MYDQERTKMAGLVIGGPVAVDSYDNAIVAALVENRPVMLVHAFNGGYLRPAALDGDSHDQGVLLATALDPETGERQGHLWYVSPAGFFGQRPLYCLESAAGQADGPDGPKRRRVAVHQDAPKKGADTVQVGLPGEVGEKWRGKNGATEDTQLWVVTVTPWGGITFVPITHPDAILGFRGHEVTAESDVRLTYNWGGDFTGTVVNTFYPRLPNEWNVPYHHVLT